VALKSRHATWPLRQGTTSKSTPIIKLLFYSISLYSTAIDLQIQGDIRRPKRKLSIFLDISNSFTFSQNPSISTPAEKKKKISFFSQSQPTQDIQNIPIYCEFNFSEDSKSAIRTQKNQIFIKIPKKTSFDLSQYSELPSPIYSKTFLGPKNINIQLFQTVAECIRKPDQKIS
jgi:hypothetical protein